MRTRALALLALVAALALVAGVPAPAGGTGGDAIRTTLVPPVIREDFTPNPCNRHDESNQGLQACLEHDIVVIDKKIDRSVAAVFRALPDAAAKQRLVKGEVAWVGARRLICASRSDVFEGGSGAPLAAAGCLLTRSREHLADVVAFQKAFHR